jgi:16S rRNA (uracil1498-N3)-methyltransferase
MPRIHCPTPLTSGAEIELPPGAARHVQVLRLQPGDHLTLFDGLQADSEFEASVTRMGRSEVAVLVGAQLRISREAGRTVHLAVVMPANERMDWLVEKAVELGVSSLQPLMSSRSVLRMNGERAQKKQAHWQAIAVSACEQCGRNRIPTVWPVQELGAWLQQGQIAGQRHVLSLRKGSQPLAPAAQAAEFTFLSGPEGGLSPQEEELALGQGFAPVSLGPRVLRAETAALAALTTLTLHD